MSNDYNRYTFAPEDGYEEWKVLYYNPVIVPIKSRHHGPLGGIARYQLIGNCYLDKKIDTLIVMLPFDEEVLNDIKKAYKDQFGKELKVNQVDPDDVLYHK